MLRATDSRYGFDDLPVLPCHTQGSHSHFGLLATALRDHIAGPSFDNCCWINTPAHKRHTQHAAREATSRVKSPSPGPHVCQVSSGPSLSKLVRHVKPEEP
ncbi:hypothetical protein EYF80_046197 [Liparis tanakae]|uniref:Uncharacterized protein n=1 Tax=Liparis tanakae TaxID=230148 RepID=A0A4Z2FSC4_9TELE|nr:hypothetical protein EYF80_046197 [Liparis tanakae]